MDPFPIRPKFATRTPPAIFPPVFGLFGLGLAWRRAGDTFQMPAALGEMILGAVTLLFVFCALAYGIKVARRPGVIPEDLRVLPGRAGLAAAVCWNASHRLCTSSPSVLLIAMRQYRHGAALCKKPRSCPCCRGQGPQ